MAINYQPATASEAGKIENAAVKPSGDDDEWEETETESDDGEDTDAGDDEDSGTATPEKTTLASAMESASKGDTDSMDTDAKGGSEEEGSEEEDSEEGSEEGSESKEHKHAPGGCGDGGDREYDLIVYGATGAIGQKAALYLAQHPDQPRFAIAGRNASKLHKLAEKIGAGAVFDALDLSNTTTSGTIRRMTGSAKVVLNLAGPFELAGAERLVAAAIHTCTHYVDTSVETAWKASLMQKYKAQAEKNEVAVVNTAGFVATPGDLLSMLAASRLAADGRGAPSKVVLAWTKWNGFDSASYIKSAGSGLLKHGPLTNRYVLAPHAMSKAHDFRAFEEWIQPERALFKMQLQLSPSATIVVPVIQQSLAEEFNGEPVIAREVDATHMQVELAQWRMNPANWMAQGSFAGEAIAHRTAAKEGTNDTAVRVAMEGTGDPAVTGSAKMSAEVALGLAASSSNVRKGFSTPSLALGSPMNLQRRLERVDGGQFMQFSIGKKFIPEPAVEEASPKSPTGGT